MEPTSWTRVRIWNGWEECISRRLQVPDVFDEVKHALYVSMLAVCQFPDTEQCSTPSKVHCSVRRLSAAFEWAPGWIDDPGTWLSCRHLPSRRHLYIYCCQHMQATALWLSVQAHESQLPYTVRNWDFVSTFNFTLLHYNRLVPCVQLLGNLPSIDLATSSRDL